MTKKILIGVLVAVLVGALAVAALDLWGGSASADGGQQHGRSAQAEGRGAGAAQDDSGSPQGNGYGRQASEGTATGDCDSSGVGQGGGRGANSAQSDCQTSQANGKGKQGAGEAASGTPGLSDNGGGNGSGNGRSNGRGGGRSNGGANGGANDGDNGRGAAGSQGQGPNGPADESAGSPGGAESYPNPQADVGEWEEYEGTVVALDDNELTITLATGEEMTIEMGPSRYWQVQELFSPEVGDSVSVLGFFDGERFEAGTITDETNGQVLTLRDEDGRPMWAGRGQRGQQ